LTSTDPFATHGRGDGWTTVQLQGDTLAAELALAVAA